MIDENDKRYEIPRKFRVSMDATDEEAFALLQQCDQEQKELGKRINSPFSRVSSQGMARSKAYTTIDTLLQTKQFQKLTADQWEQLAEAYATTGRYDLAAETSKEYKALYKKYWKAVFLDDGEWCEHGLMHQFQKEKVFSLKHGKEMSMMACNICGHWNVAETPEHLTTASKNRGKHQGQKHTSIAEALAYHTASVRKG